MRLKDTFLVPSGPELLSVRMDEGHAYHYTYPRVAVGLDGLRTCILLPNGIYKAFNRPILNAITQSQLLHLAQDKSIHQHNHYQSTELALFSRKILLISTLSHTSLQPQSCTSPKPLQYSLPSPSLAWLLQAA